MPACLTIAAVAIGVVGPTAGRFLIDITAGHSAKQFIRGEWFVGTAVLTSVVYLICSKYLGLTIWPATLHCVLFGFFFRVAALWFAWEEPLPKLPRSCRGNGHPPRNAQGEDGARLGAEVRITMRCGLSPLSLEEEFEWVSN